METVNPTHTPGPSNLASMYRQYVSNPMLELRALTGPQGGDGLPSRGVSVWDPKQTAQKVRPREAMM